MIHNSEKLHQDAASTSSSWFGQSKGFSGMPGTTLAKDDTSAASEGIYSIGRAPPGLNVSPGTDREISPQGSADVGTMMECTVNSRPQDDTAHRNKNTTAITSGPVLSARAPSFSFSQGKGSLGILSTNSMLARSSGTPMLSSNHQISSPVSKEKTQEESRSSTLHNSQSKPIKASSGKGGSLPPFNPSSSVSSIVANIASSFEARSEGQGEKPERNPSSVMFASTYGGTSGQPDLIGMSPANVSAVDAAWSSSSVWTNRGADIAPQSGHVQQKFHGDSVSAPLYSRTSTFGSALSNASETFASGVGYHAGPSFRNAIESRGQGYNYLVGDSSNRLYGGEFSPNPSSQVSRSHYGFSAHGPLQGGPALTRFNSTPSSTLDPDRSPWAPGNSPYALGASQMKDPKVLDKGFEYGGSSVGSSAAGMELWRSTSTPLESTTPNINKTQNSRIPNFTAGDALPNNPDFRSGIAPPESATVSVSSTSSSPSMMTSQDVGLYGHKNSGPKQRSSASDALMLDNPLPPLSSIANSAPGGQGRKKGKGAFQSNQRQNQDADDQSRGENSTSAKKKNINRKKGRAGKQNQNRKVTQYESASTNGQAMASSLRNSSSSLVIATSMLPPHGSNPQFSPNNQANLSLNSLQISDTQRSNVDMSGSTEGLNRLMEDRPILPSARDRGGSTTITSAPNTFPSQPPAPYTSLLDEAIASYDHNDYDFGTGNDDDEYNMSQFPLSIPSNASKKRDWLIRNNRKLKETEIGTLDPDRIPITAVMNSWAKTKSKEGAQMVELWLHRVEDEVKAGNTMVELSAKMYTMAVDAWAKSGEKGAATHAESILQRMNQMHQDGNSYLKPTSGIFNAVINAWARSGEKIGPLRAEQILEWMDKLNRNGNGDIKPDKYSYNTVIHAYAKSGGKQAAIKAQTLLNNMEKMYNEGHSDTKPDTITYNVVINAWAKSGGSDAAMEAEKLLMKMHRLYDSGNLDVKPNVVTYGSVIDSWAKSGSEGAAARADSILANMIKMHQADPIQNADLRPNTYVFNTVINAWSKSKQPDSANKAEDMLNAMGVMHSRGIPGLKPDAFTYTAVIDAWAKSGFRGAATRADQLLEKMEAEYQAGDNDLKPNTFTYNAVINALAKSGEPGAAARAERVLHSMVRRHRSGNDDVKPTTINFNTVLDAFAKSGGRGAAERAEEILEWMDRLNKSGNVDVKPDTITFNAVIDAWARSGDKGAPARAEQILEHMDELYKSGNHDVQPDTYTYNTVINAWAKSCERGSASRAEHILEVMEQRCREGDHHLKPNTRTFTSVIDAWAKSGERGAARRAEQILNSMQSQYEAGNVDVKPNSHTYNAVMNACAFTKVEEDKAEALIIAFRFFERLQQQRGMHPDAYSYTIMLSVCANLFPREDTERRFVNAKALFEKCCEQGYVNDHVLRKLRQLVTEREYMYFVGSIEQSADRLPMNWTRNAVKGGRRVRRNGGRR